MNFRFYIDPETGDPHIFCHRVSEEEVIEIFLSPSVETPGRDGARLIVGRTEEGRFLRVVYVRDPEPDSYFVITAYDLTGRQLRDFMLQWQRRN
jgi:hypothetical protein